LLVGCGVVTNQSADYCEQLPGGKWVTNNQAQAPCVPNPADATGNEKADGSVPLPRCVSCTLAEWNRAELRAEARAAAAQQAGAVSKITPALGVGSAALTAASGRGGASRWPQVARTSFVNACTLTSGGRAQVCGCIADHLSQVVSIEQLPHMELVDRRLYSAIAACGQL
jgi:hypothetical protein